MTRMYSKRRAEADRYHDEIRRIVGNQPVGRIANIVVSNEWEDTHQATDYVVSLVGGGAIAARVRLPHQTHRDFTIRYSVRSGARTEYAKLHDGWPDLYLYGWTTFRSQQEARFSEWLLVDMHRFRDAGLLDTYGGPITNTDGTKFIYWSIGSIRDAGCVLAEKMAQPTLW